MGNASALDVACSIDVIKAAKENFKKTIFASSVHPYKLLEAVKAGVDAIEIGNFVTQTKTLYFETKSAIVLKIYSRASSLAKFKK